MIKNYESSLKGEIICKEIVKNSFEVRTPGKSKENVAAGVTGELKEKKHIWEGGGQLGFRHFELQCLWDTREGDHQNRA